MNTCLFGFTCAGSVLSSTSAERSLARSTSAAGPGLIFKPRLMWCEGKQAMLANNTPVLAAFLQNRPCCLFLKSDCSGRGTGGREMREGERSKIESEESCQSSNLGSTSAHCAHSFKGEIQCDPTHSPVV